MKLRTTTDEFIKFIMQYKKHKFPFTYMKYVLTHNRFNSFKDIINTIENEYEIIDGSKIVEKKYWNCIVAYYDIDADNPLFGKVLISHRKDKEVQLKENFVMLLDITIDDFCSCVNTPKLVNLILTLEEIDKLEEITLSTYANIIHRYRIMTYNDYLSGGFYKTHEIIDTEEDYILVKRQ